MKVCYLTARRGLGRNVEGGRAVQAGWPRNYDKVSVEQVPEARREGAKCVPGGECPRREQPA